MLTRPGHRHIEEPALLVDLLGFAACHVRRNTTVDEVENKDRGSTCAVIRRRFPAGASPARRPLQPEATGAGMEATKCLKPPDSGHEVGDCASVQAATRVNAEQTSKRSMCRPTRKWNWGRLTRMGDFTSDECAHLLHRGSGGSMYTRKAHATRETPTRDQG